MKIKDGFKLHTLGSENIVVAEGDASLDYTSIITLNETGAYIWQNIVGKEFDAESITKLLLDAYEVDEATASDDAFAFVEKMLEAELVSE